MWSRRGGHKTGQRSIMTFSEFHTNTFSKGKRRLQAVRRKEARWSLMEESLTHWATLEEAKDQSQSQFPRTNALPQSHWKHLRGSSKYVVRIGKASTKSGCCSKTGFEPGCPEWESGMDTTRPWEPHIWPLLKLSWIIIFGPLFDKLINFAYFSGRFNTNTENWNF